MKILKKVINLNSKKITKKFCLVAEPINSQIKKNNLKKNLRTNSVFTIYRDILKKKKEKEEELEETNLKNKLTLKIKPNLLIKMINSVQNKTDFEILIDAFYNFTGYGNNFSQTLKDLMINKGIENKALDHVLEFYENSLWVIYFPHFNTTENFVKEIVKENDFDCLFKLSKVLKKNCFIKINQNIFDILNKSTQNIEEQNREEFSENLKVLTID